MPSKSLLDGVTNYNVIQYDGTEETIDLVDITVETMDNSNGILSAFGDTLPVDGATGYSAGGTFRLTSTSSGFSPLYTNFGTYNACKFEQTTTPRSFTATVGFENADYICDGVADDVQINAALSYVNSVGGGIVFMQGGTYTINSSLKMYNDTILQGSGMQTKIIAVNSFSGTTPTGMRQAMIYNNAATTSQPNYTYIDSNIELRDLLIDGNTAGQSGRLAGICLQYLSNARCVNLQIQNCGQSGSKESQSIWLRNNKSALIEKCMETSCDGFTISISEDCNIDNCWSFNSTSEGYFIGADYRCKVTNCYSMNSEGAGISITGSGLTTYDCQVINHHSEGCGNSGASFLPGINVGQDAYRTKVIGCSATACYSPGVRVNRAPSTQIIGGHYWNNGQNTAGQWPGILIEVSSTNCIVDGVECWDDQGGSATQEYGIRIKSDGSTGCRVVNSIVHNHINDGMRIEEDYTSLSNNYSYSNGAQGFELVNVVQCVVTGNYSYFNTQHGFRNSGTNYCVFNGNIALNNSQGSTAYAGILMLDSNYCAVTGNEFLDDQVSKTQKYAIWELTSVSTANNNTYSNNICTGGVTAVALFAGANDCIVNNTGINPMTVYAQGNVSSGTTFNRVNGSLITARLTGNITTTVTNGFAPGDTLTLQISQSGGGNTISKPANVRLVGGAFSPSAGASAVDQWTLRWDGTYWNEIGRALNIS